MIKTKTFFRSGLIFVTIISVVLCSFMMGMVRHDTSQGTPFQTVPPVNATIGTPIPPATPSPTPLPTLGPGQYFEEENKPEISTKHGDDSFGWGELARNEDLLLVWVTDDKGTYYLVIEKDNEKFMGNDIRKDGFVHYIGGDDGGRVSLVGKLKASRNRGVASSGVGIGCGVLLLFLGPAGWTTLTVAGIVALGEAGGEILYQDQLQDDIDTLETNLLARFSQMRYEYQHP